MIITTVVITGSSLLLAPFPVVIRSSYLKLFSIINVAAFKYICNIDYTVEGKENIPEGPAIIMCKHQSTWETMVLQLIFPINCFVAKRELMWIPFFGWALALMKPIFINRRAGQRALDQLVSQGTDRLNEGLWVVIFPEGTRVRPGQKKRYKIGGAILAEKSGYPIVPVAHNAGEYWQKGQFVKKPGTIKVKIGPVIESKGKKAEQLIKDVENWIESSMQEISPH
ncbi:MAG: 1-acyl-sn-glycerol-3-phosphate acyltransferase [Gammaproteobacteria bacterium]|nr:1-acyl-sn-glycerol-3-phosphate acyltransferase [Gammaproteobacteria bacterium]MDH5777771.1 1-acyl-sn-glycerol-3-phosphate acyltransferase [Gammaproteobacteria bacterium]